MENTVSKRLTAPGTGDLDSAKKRNCSNRGNSIKKMGLPRFEQRGDSIHCEFDPKYQSKFEAVSKRTGKILSLPQNSTGNSVTFSHIMEGDKYCIQQIRDTGVVTAEIQTYKTMGNRGGELHLQFGTLVFPPGAIDSDTQMGVSPSGKEVPPIPEEYWNVIPVENILILSSQERFHQDVICKFCLPFITAAEDVEFIIMRGENGQWISVSSTKLTKDKTIEFACDHFSPILIRVAMHLPYWMSKLVPITWTMKNVIYCSDFGNFIIVTCLDVPSTLSLCNAGLCNTTYKKSAFDIDSFDIRPGQTAHYVLKSISQAQACEIGRWEFKFDREFSQTYVHKKQLRLTNDDGQFDGVRVLELSFERQCGDTVDYVAQGEANANNPFYRGNEGLMCMTNVHGSVIHAMHT